MYEDEMIMAMMVAFALALWVVKLKLSNRKLRKQIAAANAAPVEAAAAVPPTRQIDRDSEVDRLRDRVAVLERITVEKESSLAREIDGLRHR